mmetsp:Transcript_59155/g.157427  ORF Transcript_59155/g.157427 Transcript_59155/m.157427 type:complete len:146 (-) Transcript_59155:313-750(-)
MAVCSGDRQMTISTVAQRTCGRGVFWMTDAGRITFETQPLGWGAVRRSGTEDSVLKTTMPVVIGECARNDLLHGLAPDPADLARTLSGRTARMHGVAGGDGAASVFQQVAEAKAQQEADRVVLTWFGANIDALWRTCHPTWWVSS